MYGNYIMIVGGIRQCCFMFKNVRSNVHDDEWIGWLNIMTDELMGENNGKICENCRLTIAEVLLQFPRISQRLLHEVVMQKLGYHSFCDWWVQKIKSEHHKKQCVASSLTFLEAYDKGDDSILDRVITRDETCVKHLNCIIKSNLFSGGGHTSYRKPRKCL